MSSSEPAKIWQEALVSGNGTMGAMVFGRTDNERVVFNHERLYEPLLDEPCPVPDLSGSLPEVRRLLLAGKYKEAYEYSWQYAKKKGFPGIQWTDPYHPACAFELQQPKGKVDDYLRTTNFESGEIVVSWKDDQGKTFRRQTFVSRTDGVVVIRNSSEVAAIQGKIALVNQDSRDKSMRTDKFGGGYLDPEITTSDDFIEYRCKYTRSKRGYVVVARVLAIDGSVSSDASGIGFNGKEQLILVAIESLEDYGEVEKVSQDIRKKLNSISPNYDQLLKSHAAVHGEMFNRVRLDLGGKHATAEALIALQAKTRDTELNLELLEQMFHMGRYTLISSSGEWPPNLMGIWNGDWRPKWSGDFTLDANVNLQIAAANLGNLPEAIHSYSRLINGLIPDWETNAKRLYGCRGVLSGTRTSGRNNLNTHYSRGFPGHFWTAGAQWLVLPMFEHYQTTGDDEFLKEHLSEVMTTIAVFYVDFLAWKDLNEDRMFAPSYSPENKPANTKSPATINATMDIACAKEALTNLVALVESKKLNVDEALLKQCKEMLVELPPYLLAKDGAIKEWAWGPLEDNNNHRTCLSSLSRLAGA